jgi:AraC family transcriptional regulator
MRQSAISASGFLEALPSPPQTSAEWSIFSVHLVEPPPHFAGKFSDHVLALQLSGTCRFRREIGGRPIEGWSGPGCVHLIPAHVHAKSDGRDHSGSSRAIVLFMPQAFLSRVIAEDWGVAPGSVEILPQFLARDPVMEGVLRRLALEARNGSPSGQLYAESACEFLAHHIIHTHSSLSPDRPRAKGGLPGGRLKLVLDYIEDGLAQPIALRRLAELASVSPRHLERAFRQSLGIPPHAYVMRKRVAAAQHLLLSEPRLSIEEIAARSGFSSGSHLASAFRRQTGYSPANFRRLAR